MILDPDKDIRNLQMDASIRVPMKMGKCMAKASIPGKMGKFIRENGSITSSMALECGKTIKGIHI